MEDFLHYKMIEHWYLVFSIHFFLKIIIQMLTQ